MNDLNRRLTAMADEEFLDMSEQDFAALRTRVYATSRRIGRRRAIGGVLAALLVAGAVTAGTLQLASRNSAMRPGDWPSVGPSREPTTATSPGPAIPGTLVFLRAELGGPLEVITIGNAEFTTVRFGTLGANEMVAVVSPDRSKIAVVGSANVSSTSSGELSIVEPGGRRTKLVDKVNWSGERWPVWSADSKELFVNFADGRLHGVNASTGATRSVTGLSNAQDVNYLTLSRNGHYLGFATGDRILTMTPGGSQSREMSVAGQPECEMACPTALQAISEDGRYAATTIGNSDPSRVRNATLVLDLVDKRRLALPNLGGSVDEIFFGDGLNMVIRTVVTDAGPATIHLIGPNLQVNYSTTLPIDLTGADLVAYIP